MNSTNELKDMVPEIRDQWLADLRDGTRRQGHGKLRDVDGRQCCLDVLSEQGVRAGVIREPKLNLTETSYTYTWIDELGVEQEEEGLLPKPIVKWAGLETSNPEVYLYLTDDEAENFDDDVDRVNYQTDLADVNDEFGRTFSQIADLIEATVARD